MSPNTLIISSRPTTNVNDKTWELSGLTGALILASWIFVLILFISVFCLTVTMCVDMYRTYRKTSLGYPVAQQTIASGNSNGIGKRTEHVLDLVSVHGYE